MQVCPIHPLYFSRLHLVTIFQQINSHSQPLSIPDFYRINFAMKSIQKKLRTWIPTRKTGSNLEKTIQTASESALPSYMPGQSTSLSEMSPMSTNQEQDIAVIPTDQIISPNPHAAVYSTGSQIDSDGDVLTMETTGKVETGSNASPSSTAAKAGLSLSFQS
jgi:hypothetical protein